MAWNPRIFHGRDDEGGRLLIRGSRWKIAAHGYALGISLGDEIISLTDILWVVPASEEASRHSRTTGPEDFLSFHGIKKRVARILLGPDAGQASRA